ncbi:hypothetical protein [Cupriavidus basilensis]|uniref:hypothetical protein n=1 Tax=Cupriavidus basilensis TaxID=68895 RepID=UPI0020A6383E|nr:hypothetical protein [Cupriavidus basilensis]MCP3019392.1 hypothetical protein [Cupriavidus basilensis]
MKIAIAMAIAVLLPATVYAAGPANPADRYDYNMRSTNKDGYVPDPQRTTNKDGYVPDTAKANDKFDPYTQGANQNTASALTDSKASTKKPAGKAPSQKKSPTAGMDK